MIFVKHLLSTKEEFDVFCKRSNEINQWILKLANRYSISYHKTKNVFEKDLTNPLSSPAMFGEVGGRESSVNKFQNTSLSFGPAYISSYNETSQTKVIQKIEKLWQRSAELLSLGTILIRDTSTKILNLDKDNVQVSNQATMRAAKSMGLSLHSLPEGYLNPENSLSTSSFLVWNKTKKGSKKKKKINYL